MTITLAVAIGAGLLSFLSPCVLPVVPAYVGQLTAIAVAGRSNEAGAAGMAGRGRWLAVRHSIAFVVGFGLIFTLLGVTATYLAGPLVDYLPALRQAGGVLLVLLGLNLAGILRVPALERTWRPLEAGAAASVASATGTLAIESPDAAAGRASFGDRLGGRIVTARGGWLASFGLGSIFAIGWTPCIGLILSAIVAMAATSDTVLQGGALLVAYSAGLGLPFIAIAAIYDRAPGVLRPLVRHGRAVSLIGGLLVVAIGVAMVMDWLVLLPRYFQFLTAI